MSDPSREFNPRAHGNIYTPHAGQMVIHVARESGLQSRTFVLSPGQVRLLRFLFRSRASRIGGIMALVLVVIQAARVPVLNYRIQHMQHDAARLDTLERSLGELQKRYDQVQKMLGASSTPTESFPSLAGDTLHHSRSARGPRAVAAAAAPTDSVTGKTDSTLTPVPSKSADPMD